MLSRRPGDHRPGRLPQPVSANSGNNPRASSAHSCWLTAARPGTMPAASPAARYLRTVFRDSPRLGAVLTTVNNAIAARPHCSIS